MTDEEEVAMPENMKVFHDNPNHKPNHNPNHKPNPNSNLKVHDNDDWGVMIEETFTTVTKVGRQVDLLKEQGSAMTKLADRVLSVDRNHTELEMLHDFKIKTLEGELEAANVSRLRAEQVRMELEENIESIKQESVLHAETAVTSRHAEPHKTTLQLVPTSFSPLHQLVLSIS